MDQPSIAFIGTGNMASSLISGLIKDKYSPQKIFASDPNLDKLKRLQEKYQIQIAVDNTAACKQADVIILAVKPDAMRQVTLEIRDAIERQLIISIAAGIPCKSMYSWFAKPLPIVRCMPNTPALIGSGATALFATKNTSAQQREIAETILRAVGVVVWIDQEEQLDIITALSGSGPAYFLLVMESLINAAQDSGLDEKTASLLTLQTALGTARMALESNESVEILRLKVTSPGGTTERAVKILEDHQIREIFSKALQGAKQRAQEIAGLF